MDNESENEEPVSKVYVVDEIVFQYKDHESLSKGQLSSVMVLNDGKPYNSNIMGMDMKRLKKYYFDNGFFDAIIDTNVVYVDVEGFVEGEAIVNVIIYERDHFMYKNLEYKGLDYVAPNVKDMINKDKIINDGEFYSRIDILTEAKRVVDILQNNGYYNSGLDTSEGIIVSKYFSSDPALKNKVKVELSFHGADKIFYFGKTTVNIMENKYGLRENIVRKSLDYNEGDIFNREKVFQSERNFSQIQLVANGRIEIDTITNDDILDLEVVISLQNKYEITPSVGGIEVDGQFYVGGGVEYLNKNFLHHGGWLSLSINAYLHSANVNRIELINKFTQPFLFNNRITFSLENRLGYYNIEDIEFFGLKNLGRFNYLISPHTFYQNALFDITIDVLRIKYKTDFLDESGRVVFTSGTIDDQLNSILGVTAIHDRTNDLFNPSAGMYHGLTVEHAGALARLIILAKKDLNYSQYIKIFTPNKYFLDLSTSDVITSILATKFHIGEIFEYGSDDNLVPIQEIYKFYSGGSNSVRGWAAKTNGMVGNPENGGKFLIDGSIEHRLSLFPNDPGFLKNIWGVYFFDYGNIWESHRAFKFKDISMAIGAGIRYYTFVGPIRVDLGFKLYDPKAKDGEHWLFQNFSIGDKVAIQFGIGNAF